MSHRIALIGMCVVAASYVSGQTPLTDPIAFEQATAVERVLPQSSVYDILQDNAGFLWFGTREGVARWDGYEVRTWKHDPFNAASLPGNVVRALVEDRFGSIWALTNTYLDLPAGIARLVGPAYERVERFELNGHIALDDSGSPLLITHDSVFTYDSTRATFTVAFARTDVRDLPLPLGTRFTSSVTTSDGTLWNLDPLRGLERCNLHTSACGIVDVGPTAEVPSGRLWIDDRDGSLWIPHKDRILTLRDDRLAIAATLAPNDHALDFSAGADSAVWILSQQGVSRIRAKELSRTIKLPTLANTANQAPIAIATDQSGTLWVGTVWGLYRRQSHRAQFGHLQHDPRDDNTLSSGLVVSLAEDSTGNIWVGTIGGGLNRWNRSNGRVARFRYNAARTNTLSHDVVWAIDVDSSGIVWAGASYGLNRIDRSGNLTRYIRDPDVPWFTTTGAGNTITDLQSSTGGRVWLACGAFCGDSLLYFDSAQRRFGGVHLPGIHHPGYFRLASPDNAWIGSQSGLHLVDLRSGNSSGMLDSAGGNLDGVLAFQPTTGGMWVGANSGLYRYSASGHLEARYTDAEGLPSNAVYGVLEDPTGRVWVSTNRGLAAIAPAEDGGEVLRQYDESDGVGNVEFNRNAYLAGRDGTFYFGGDRGLTYFRPSDFTPNTFQPPVVITGVTRSTRSGTSSTVPSAHASIRIAPSDYTFSISFAALNFINPHRNRYRVKLEGFDDVWKDYGTARVATYTNVPPGTYRFMVLGSNDDGLWSPVPAVASVVVEPRTAQTPWFKGGMALLFGSLIALATWYVSRAKYQLALAHSVAEQQLGLERARISRDMHDEVGANLTEISILSELAGTTGSAEFLDRIGAKARNTIDSIGEIIWAIDPRNDEGDRFSSYLHQHAADFLENTGIRAHLSFPSPGTIPLVSAERRRTVLLVLKEALANSAKHGAPSTIDVTLGVADAAVQLVVADNGRGFDAASLLPPGTGHNGLSNMVSRAEAVGGSCVISSKPGTGTTIRLTIPLSGAVASAGAP